MRLIYAKVTKKPSYFFWTLIFCIIFIYSQAPDLLHGFSEPSSCSFEFFSALSGLKKSSKNFSAFFFETVIFTQILNAWMNFMHLTFKIQVWNSFPCTQVWQNPNFTNDLWTNSQSCYAECYLTRPIKLCRYRIGRIKIRNLEEKTNRKYQFLEIL